MKITCILRPPKIIKYDNVITFKKYDIKYIFYLHVVFNDIKLKIIFLLQEKCLIN